MVVAVGGAVVGVVADLVFLFLLHVNQRRPAHPGCPRMLFFKAREIRVQWLRDHQLQNREHTLPDTYL